MKVFLCIDDNGGMLFNNRRQSRDKYVIDDVLSCAGAPLYISDFSKALFDGCENTVTVSEALLSCPENGSCFIENEDIAPFLGKISELVIYRWNRSYPYDTLFSVSPENEGFSLKESRDFAGFSHKKITREAWVK